MDKSKQVSEGVVEQNEGAASLHRSEPDQSNEKPKKSAREMVEALVSEAVAEAVANEVDRRFQSAKDKRWDELEKQYGSLSELAERLGESTGASAEQETNETASAVEEFMLAVPEGDAPAAPTASLTERVQALAKLPGLRENEDARAMLLRHAKPDGMEDYAALLEDLLRLGGGELKIESTPSTPASVVIPGGGDAPADLRQAYERRRRALRPGDVQALTALKREFRQKGLDVF